MELDHLSRSSCNYFCFKLFRQLYSLRFAYHVFHFLFASCLKESFDLRDLDFSFVLLHNPRHPSHPPVIPGLWRCEFGTLWKPVFWLGRGEWGFIPTDPHHVFGCLGLHYIFPYVLNSKQQWWHAVPDIAPWSTPEFTPQIIRTSEQKGNEQTKTCRTFPKLTWHRKMDGWKTSFFGGWFPCRCYG